MEDVRGNLRRVDIPVEGVYFKVLIYNKNKMFVFSPINPHYFPIDVTSWIVTELNWIDLWRGAI